MALPSYTAEEVDAAVASLADPDRYEHAQQIVTHAAPSLQKVLNTALAEGGWFGEAHETQLTRAVGVADSEQRLSELRVLIAEEVRLGMLVGVTVGFELARELAAGRDGPSNENQQEL